MKLASRDLVTTRVSVCGRSSPPLSPALQRLEAAAARAPELTPEQEAALSTLLAGTVEKLDDLDAWLEGRRSPVAGGSRLQSTGVRDRQPVRPGASLGVGEGLSKRPIVVPKFCATLM